MSLELYLTSGVDGEEIYETNITHNLGKMAGKAGIYKALWRPQETAPEPGGTLAKDLILPLRLGLSRLIEDAPYYKQFDASNGWGTHEQFVPWVYNVLQACINNPNAVVTASV